MEIVDQLALIHIGAVFGASQPNINNLPISIEDVTKILIDTLNVKIAVGMDTAEVRDRVCEAYVSIAGKSIGKLPQPDIDSDYDRAMKIL